MENSAFGYCQCCGEVLEGRTDKKFCTNICKSRYHNSILHKTTSKVHRTLWKNRTILESLLRTGKNSITLSELLKLGFKINHVTKFEDGEKGTGVTYLFVYDIGFYDDGQSLIKIFKP